MSPRDFVGRGVNTTHASNTFDYVVVGGGTAGLVVANRLSANPSVRVAVIEAGTFYEIATGNASQIPIDDTLYNGKNPSDTGPIDWDFTTTPQAGMNNQVVHFARGKTLGGCSALNYMAYARTTVGAFEKWADDVGDTSWTYENVSDFYYKSTNFTPPDESKRIANSTPEYDTSTLGTGGPLKVTFANYAQGWSTWIAKAMPQVGIPSINGFTSGKLMGSSWLVSTINHTTGDRDSSETAFLRPFLGRTNLVVYTDTLAERILFDGQTAKGVQVSSGNNSYTISATKEVILSAGTFQSPQLLQVSGVGPADLLKEHGIDIVADRPGVGQGMNDHISFGISYRVNVQTDSALLYGHAMQEAIEEFDNEQNGLLSSPGGDFGGYEKLPLDIRSNFSKQALQQLSTFPADWPEIEWFTLPAYAGNAQAPGAATPQDGFQYATLLAIGVAPLSRGNISISSPSMHDQPLINPNWLTADTDIETAIGGFKRTRQILAAPVMKGVLIGPEYVPGPNVTTDDQILQYIRSVFNTLYHPSSTCKMGKRDDKLAVVDSRARVYGTKNLRVVDASAFPFLPPGLPQAAVYMLAEKISAYIINGD